MLRLTLTLFGWLLAVWTLSLKTLPFRFGNSRKGNEWSCLIQVRFYDSQENIHLNKKVVSSLTIGFSIRHCICCSRSQHSSGMVYAGDSYDRLLWLSLMHIGAVSFPTFIWKNTLKLIWNGMILIYFSLPMLTNDQWKSHPLQPSYLLITDSH